MLRASIAIALLCALAIAEPTREEKVAQLKANNAALIQINLVLEKRIMGLEEKFMNCKLTFSTCELC
jgi:hypothetical protein